MIRPRQEKISIGASNHRLILCLLFLQEFDVLAIALILGDCQHGFTSFRIDRVNVIAKLDQQFRQSDEVVFDDQPLTFEAVVTRFNQVFGKPVKWLKRAAFTVGFRNRMTLQR